MLQITDSCKLSESIAFINDTESKIKTLIDLILEQETKVFSYNLFQPLQVSDYLLSFVSDSLGDLTFDFGSLIKTESNADFLYKTLKLASRMAVAKQEKCDFRIIETPNSESLFFRNSYLIFSSNDNAFLGQLIVLSGVERFT